MSGGIFSVLACMAFLAFFAIVFGFFAFWRYLQYRETVVLAEKGLIRPTPANGGVSAALRWGIVIAALGLALSLGLYPLGFLSDSVAGRFPLRFGPWMLIGLVPLFFGLALVLIHAISRDNNHREVETTRTGETAPVASPGSQSER